ncbi:hypothetical protein LK07_29530 [Streptomyces pluripotens]|uniref:Uncharacterized protein n=1 Tax=Streptomyces pluripotens TaxID=1355015 RepID=A0A221P5Q4_9ACTN|nr:MULTISPECIES: hypothetical protein [Streptomyces]ARP73233.1 hypothetical protein LK06_028360 [Streptomyces pluripotens]ASN27482.1 hypothetical protein LK07_29530 [Streptomyces pluripotens]KIE24422.1 hypothetical protein LK08_24580 [Streptomyces sp. MUSC 125]MCH0560495.1 hypothetical protein [Streptomyces sp. MUM 16J]
MNRTAVLRGTAARTAVVVAATALVLTSCARDDGSGTPAVPTARSHARALTPTEDLRITDAEQRLIRRCMARHGFRYWEDRTLTARESRPLGYVQDDLAWARVHGYGSRIRAKEDRARLHNPNIAYRAALPATRKAAYDTAMDGGHDAEPLRTRTPGGGTVAKRSGGCTGAAEETLYGDPATWFRLDTTASNLRPLYVGRLLKDRRFTAAVDAWSRCMARAGHPYPDPQAARQATRDHPAEQTQAEEARSYAAETRIAVADATCARSVLLGPIGREREAYYLNRLPRAYVATLDAYRQLRLTALRRAEHITPARA